MNTNYQNKAPDYFKHDRKNLVDFIPPEATVVLDVGCSSGGFGAQLMRLRADREVWGIEPISEAAEEAAKHLTRVFCSGIEETLQLLPDNHFDCITFNDVLEHIANPGEILGLIRQKLKNGGTLFASIPNLRFFPVIKSLIVDADFQYQQEGVLDKTHLRFFTKISMCRLFTENGYDVKQVGGLNWLPFPFWLRLLNLLTRRRLDDMHYLQFAIIAHVRGIE